MHRQEAAQNLVSSQAIVRTGPQRKLGRRDSVGRERERLKKGEGRGERQNRKSNEATLHLILHVSTTTARTLATATTATPVTTETLAAASAAMCSDVQQGCAQWIPSAQHPLVGGVGSDWLYDRVRQEVDVEPSATVRLDLNSAAIRDVSYDSLFNASEFNAF